MTIKASSERCLVRLLCHTITGHYKCPRDRKIMYTCATTIQQR